MSRLTKRLFWLLLFWQVAAWGGTPWQQISNNAHLYLGWRAETQQHYEEAYHHYQRVTLTNDTLHYNLGNTLYHLQRYEEAMVQYMQITTASLMHAKLHNIGNCLMKLDMPHKAIALYTNALKFKKHPNTQSNLDLARARYAKKLEEKKREQRKEAKENLMLRKGTEKIDRFEDNNGSDTLIEAPAPKQITKMHNSSLDEQKTKEETIAFSREGESNSSIVADKQSAQESYRQRRWQRYLQKHTLKTLLIPLPSSGENHDTNPY